MGARMWGFKRLLFVLAGILLSSPVLAEPMSFFADISEKHRFTVLMTRGGVHDIYATGEITPDSAARLIAFAKANRIEFGRIYFNSPGGSLIGGIELGRAIRALNYQTAIGVYNPTYVSGAGSAAVCASACAYAFAGGTARFLDDNGGRLGIHQFYAPNSNISGESVQQVSGLIVAYLDEMGVDARAFTLSTAADRSGMIWLPQSVALRLRFADNGEALPVAEIRMTNMQPYLRIQQDFHNVTTRVLFTCFERRLRIAYGVVTDEEGVETIMGLPSRSYLELDFAEFMPMPGRTGIEGADSTVWIWRDLSPTALAQIVRANRLEGWVDGSGALRWGSRLDLPTVRGKIVEYAKQCAEVSR